MTLSAMGSSSDAHETREIPIIAANLQRLILPRQSQIWAVRGSKLLGVCRHSKIQRGAGGRIEDMEALKFVIWRFCRSVPFPNVFNEIFGTVTNEVLGTVPLMDAAMGHGCVVDDEKKQPCRAGKGGLSYCRNECHGINCRASEGPRPARVDRAGGGLGEGIRRPMFLVQASRSAVEIHG
jgi:hypothetical protein